MDNDTLTHIFHSLLTYYFNHH